MVKCTLKNFEGRNVTNISHLKSDFRHRLCPGNPLNDTQYAALNEVHNKTERKHFNVEITACNHYDSS